MDIQYLPVSWEQYHSYAQKLAATILAHEQYFDEIVAVSRGGLTFGHLLSDLLNLPVCTFTIQSYTDIKEQGEIKITEPLSKPIEGKRILMVDDVSDSGTTIKRALAYVQGFKPQSITVVTMFYKPHSTYRPDFFAKQTTKWILFPYEPTEMIRLITQNMVSHGKSKAEIQDFLLHLGYSLNQVKFVRKYHLK